MAGGPELAVVAPLPGLSVPAHAVWLVAWRDSAPTNSSRSAVPGTLSAFSARREAAWRASACSLMGSAAATAVVLSTAGASATESTSVVPSTALSAPLGTFSAWLWALTGEVALFSAVETCALSSSVVLNRSVRLDERVHTTAVGVIVLGSHRALLFRGQELPVTVTEKARGLGVRNVPQFGHVRRGSNLKESAHLGNRGLKRLRLRSRFFLGIGHRGRVRLCRRYWTWFRLRNIRCSWFLLRNGGFLFFKRCGSFFGLGATDCDDSLVFLDVFKGVFCFHFDVVGFGFGSLSFNGFVGLNGNGFGAFCVLFLNGLVEAARFLFLWRTRFDELSGTLIDRKESSEASLRSLDPSVSLKLLLGLSNSKLNTHRDLLLLSRRQATEGAGYNTHIGKSVSTQQDLGL
jgi:hypothetical protein